MGYRGHPSASCAVVRARSPPPERAVPQGPLVTQRRPRSAWRPAAARGLRRHWQGRLAGFAGRRGPRARPRRIRPPSAARLLLRADARRRRRRRPREIKLCGSAEGFAARPAPAGPAGPAPPEQRSGRAEPGRVSQAPDGRYETRLRPARFEYDQVCVCVCARARAQERTPGVEEASGLRHIYRGANHIAAPADVRLL